MRRLAGAERQVAARWEGPSTRLRRAVRETQGKSKAGGETVTGRSEWTSKPTCERINEARMCFFGDHNTEKVSKGIIYRMHEYIVLGIL